MRSAQPGPNNPEPVDYNPNEFWLRTLLRWYIGLVIRPSPTIREIVERRPVWAGVVGLPASGFLWVGQLMSYDFSNWPISVFALAVSVLALILAGGLVSFSFVMAGAVHITARLARCHGDFTKMYAGLMLVASALSWTAAAIGFTFIVVDNFVISWKRVSTDQTVSLWLALVALIWIIVLFSVVVRENYKIGLRRSALVTLGGLGAGLPVAVILQMPLIFATILVGFELESIALSS